MANRVNNTSAKYSIILSFMSSS